MKIELNSLILLYDVFNAVPYATPKRIQVSQLFTFVCILLHSIDWSDARIRGFVTLSKLRQLIIKVTPAIEVTPVYGTLQKKIRMKNEGRTP